MKRIFISFQCRGTATKGNEWRAFCIRRNQQDFIRRACPLKTIRHHLENWLRRAKGSLLKIISPMNPLNLLNHREAVCLYINKFLRND